MAIIKGTGGDDNLTGTEVTLGAITLISTNADGVAGNNTSQNPDFSADGNLVAFASKASNFVDGDANGTWDIFVKNLTTGAITLVSDSASGVIGDHRSLEPAISSNGTKVAFSSRSTDLIDGHAESGRQLYLKDLTTGAVNLIATEADGSHTAGKSFDPQFSPDGTKIVFYSWEALDPRDDNHLRDIYVKDLVSGAVTLVSDAADGSIANKQSIDPVFSPDGTKVMFASIASNLVAGDVNGEKDIFIKDLTTGAVTLVSTGTHGQQGNDESGQYYTSMAWSPDGTKVAFSSEASNFAAGDNYDAPQIFVKDLTTGEIMCASTSAAGAIGNDDSGQWAGTLEFSPDGTKVLFASAASNLVAGDTNGKADIFVKDLVTGDISRMSTDGFGNQSDGAGFRPVFTPDGKAVAFQDNGDNLVPGDTNGHADIFLKTIPVSGDDVITARDGNDSLSGGSGDDVLNGGAGNDTMDGGTGIDTADYHDGAAGITVSLVLTTAQDTGGSGSDTLSNIENLIGSVFDDVLTGSTLDNLMAGGDGADRLNGGNGNDALDGGAGNDTLAGGHGIDTANYGDATAAVTVTLWSSAAQQTGGSGIDTLIQIENVAGSVFGDTFTGSNGDNLMSGSAGDDVLLGKAGNDELVGGVGDDLLVGGAGDDRMEGGNGIDTVSYASAETAVTVHLFPMGGQQDTGGAGVDTIIDVENLTGSRFDDTLYGGRDTNLIQGGDGNDVIFGVVGDDVLAGGTGNDTIAGGSGFDTIDGGDGSDAIDGGNDNDVIHGMNGDDRLLGSAGDDIVFGGRGNDSIQGGLGADALHGGSGSDVFVYRHLAESGVSAATRDTIADFTSGKDKIDLAPLDAIEGQAHSAFTLVAGGFTHHAGELTVSTDAGSYMVSGDVNGDGVADFSILVIGKHEPVAADFIL